MSRTITISDVETTVCVDVEIDIDDYMDEILEKLGEPELEVWDNLARKAQLFGVDDLKRYIEENLYSRYGFRYEL